MEVTIFLSADPDPDLGPIEISKEQKDQWLNELPELPSKKRQKYVNELGLSPYDSRVISDEVFMANFFEETVANGADPKLASNWITSDIVGYLKSNKQSFADLKLSPINLAEIINLVIKIAQNKEVNIPIIKVVANPLIGPVPKENKIIPVNKVVTLASIIEEYAAL